MYLYAIQDSTSGYIKIGYSANPEHRLRELQTGNSGALRLIHTSQIKKDRARLVEQQLHKEIGHLKIRGEWFNINESFAREMIDYAIIRYENDILI